MRGHVRLSEEKGLRGRAAAAEGEWGGVGWGVAGPGHLNGIC